MLDATKIKVGDIVVFYDGFPGPYGYLGVVESLNGGKLTFHGLEIETTFTRPVGDFDEADESDKVRARGIQRKISGEA